MIRRTTGSTRHDTLLPYTTLCRSVEPLWVEQFTIVTASPNRIHFKEFLKRVGKLRFLPHWSLDDLMRILPYVELPGELVEKERSEAHTSELQSLMRISYAVFCLKKKTQPTYTHTTVRL